MELIKRQKNTVVLKVTTPEDLWYLTFLITEGDQLKGKTWRKIRLGGNEQKSQVTKKPLLVTLDVKKLTYDPDGQKLKVLGTIIESNDPEVAHGSHQSLTIEEQTVITLTKKQWYSFQEEKLQEALKTTSVRFLLIVHDREEALFGVLFNNTVTVLRRLKGDVQKKDLQQESKNFYKQIAQTILTLMEQDTYDTLILASPSFFKEYVLELLPEELRQKIVLATVSSVTEQAFGELLKREELKTALQHQRIAYEAQLIDQFMKAIHQGDKATYGYDQCLYAAQAGAVSDLLIVDQYMQKMMEKEQYQKVDELLKRVEQQQGTVHIINAHHEDGQKLLAMGGIGALLRFPIQ